MNDDLSFVGELTRVSMGIADGDHGQPRSSSGSMDPAVTHGFSFFHRFDVDHFGRQGHDRLKSNGGFSLWHGGVSV